MVWVPTMLSQSLTWCFLLDHGSRLGIRLQERPAIQHCQYLYRYDSFIWWRSACSVRHGTGGKI